MQVFFLLPGAFITPPEVANTGTRFLTGGPGAAPGGVASKNGWVYMRVQGGFNFLYPFCPYVCLSFVKQPLVSKMARAAVASAPERLVAQE